MDFQYFKKKAVLQERYGQFADQFAGYTGDRLVFCNQYAILIETCNKMARIDTDSPFIQVAVNEKMKEYEKSMQEIVHHFAGLLWCEDVYRWQKE